MARHLVLGGTGFIGSHLVRRLAQAGHAVVSVGRRPGAADPDGGVARRELDLFACSAAELGELVAPAAVVHHLAWSSFPSTAEADPPADLCRNVGFTLKLLAAARDAGARVVFCSSGGTVYGPAPLEAIPEDHPLRPIGAYGAAKVAAEVYAAMFRRAHGLDVRIARLANPYGPGQAPERMQGALSRFTYAALHRHPIEIWGDGQTVRDYLHVDDAADALMRLGEAPADSLGDEPVFNIGSGQGHSLNDLVARLEAALGRKVEVAYRAPRQIDAPRNVLDIDRARRRLHWRPRIPLDEGVRRLIAALA